MWGGGHDWPHNAVGQHKAWGSTMMIKYMLQRSKVLPRHVANNHTADCTVVRSTRKGAIAFGTVVLIVSVGVVGYFAKTKLYDPHRGGGAGGYSVVSGEHERNAPNN